MIEEMIKGTRLEKYWRYSPLGVDIEDIVGGFKFAFFVILGLIPFTIFVIFIKYLITL